MHYVLEKNILFTYFAFGCKLYKGRHAHFRKEEPRRISLCSEFVVSPYFSGLSLCYKLYIRTTVSSWLSRGPSAAICKCECSSMFHSHAVSDKGCNMLTLAARQWMNSMGCSLSQLAKCRSQFLLNRLGICPEFYLK